MKFFKTLFDSNERELKRIKNKYLRKVNRLEEEISKLPDDVLATKTGEFKERIKRGASLETLLPEAFAVVREVAKRKLNMRHYDVQIIGGVVLHEGKIAEMQTGEGKTLVATLPAYLNSLKGQTHIVTVNDYLAKRDRYWMGPIYEFLGLKVGLLQNEFTPEQRKEAYRCDVVYGTNHEFGFDYLRDNMAYSLDEIVQGPLDYAIVDEVDSILIDEARTPLIISGIGEEDTTKYKKANLIARKMVPGVDFEVDPESKAIMLQPSGIKKIENFYKIDNLFEFENAEIHHLVLQALKANYVFQRDKDYVVRNGEVIIVDEFTGRLMYGRRYSDGLHQAIEAKEGLKIRAESLTLATITIQNFFRMYKKLAGMTGTAKTEEEEFKKIYGLRVTVIPTNKPLRRKILPDLVFKTERAKFKAVVEEIVKNYKKGRPVLVGTTSIENSEKLSKMLRRRLVPHQVLNAKHHEKEAEIVAQAGRVGDVTIATNMAGRRTYILLGGNPEFLAKAEMKKLLKKRGKNAEWDEETYQKILKEKKELTEREKKQVIDLGGLLVIGTERHESRRIDNQLKGRCGRQGDPGTAVFFVSLEDELLQRFGGERIKNLMERFNFPEDEPLSHPLISATLESIQKKVEAYNFDIRKTLLKYDDVVNQQRDVIYRERRKILEEKEISQYIFTFIDSLSKKIVSGFQVPIKDFEQFKLTVSRFLPITLTEEEVSEIKEKEALVDFIRKKTERAFEERFKEWGRELSDFVVRTAALRAIDRRWIENLSALQQLRESLSYRGYERTDPVLIYQKEAFKLYEEMLTKIEIDIVRLVYLAKAERRTAFDNVEKQYSGGELSPEKLPRWARRQMKRRK